MGYEAYIRCDKCGETMRWVNSGPNYNLAVRIARDIHGWQVGKLGWFCPKCRTRKRRRTDG